MHRVLLKPSAAKDLEKMERPLQRRIIAKLDDLSRSPRGTDTRKLAGEEELYRVRVGDVRIIYQIQDRELIVLVVRIARRDEVYRGLK